MDLLFNYVFKNDVFFLLVIFVFSVCLFWVVVLSCIFEEFLVSLRNDDLWFVLVVR